MTLAQESVTTSPKTAAHMRVVIDRLRRQAGTTSGTILPSGGTAAVAITLGDVLYAPSAGNLNKAIATALATARVVGVAVESISSGATGTMQTCGVVEIATWSLTANTVYYLSKDTAGAITATAPTATGEVVIPVGFALSATELRLLSVPPILL